MCVGAASERANVALRHIEGLDGVEVPTARSPRAVGARDGRGPCVCRLPRFASSISALQTHTVAPQQVSWRLHQPLPAKLKRSAVRADAGLVRRRTAATRQTLSATGVVPDATLPNAAPRALESRTHEGGRRVSRTSTRVATLRHCGYPARIDLARDRGLRATPLAHCSTK